MDIANNMKYFRLLVLSCIRESKHNKLPIGKNIVISPIIRSAISSMLY